MITIHLITKDAGRAADWYTTVFGAEERRRITLPDGRLIDVELDVGGTTLVLADEFPEYGALSPATTGQSSAVLYLHVADLETLWQRALANGATVHRAIADWFTGDRDGQIVDPFGHRWGLSQHVRDVPREVVVREAARVFGGGSAH
jgi:PhnB protein